MTTRPAISPAQHEPELPGQTVIMIGGSSGIGLETARRAGADESTSSSLAAIPAGCSTPRPNSARCAMHASPLAAVLPWLFTWAVSLRITAGPPTSKRVTAGPRR